MNVRETTRSAHLAEIKPNPLERLQELIPRLRANSPVLEPARAAVTSGRPTSIDPLISVLAGSGRYTHAEREAAVRILGCAGLDSRDREVASRLLEGVLSETPREAAFSRLVRGVGWSTLLFVSAIPLVAKLEMAARHALAPMEISQAVPLEQRSALMEQGLLRQQQVGLIVSWLMLSFILAVGVGGSMLWDRARYRRANRIRAAAAEALGALEATQALDSLAAALSERESHLRISAARALKQILPSINGKDQGELSSATQSHLARSALSHDRELALLALRALETTGGSAAVPYLERATEFGSTPEICAAARETLAIVRSRLVEKRRTAALLRPTASASAATDTTLLRPHDSTEIETDQLLRASTGDSITDG